MRAADEKHLKPITIMKESKSQFTNLTSSQNATTELPCSSSR